MTRAFFAILLATIAVGCPSASDESTVVDTCAKSGVQCRIDGSQLGVCMMSTDGTFTCASQH